MKHELLALYKLANETKDKDAIRAFQQARDRIGPQIAVDLILENNRLRAEIDAEKRKNEQVEEENRTVRSEAYKSRAIRKLLDEELAAERMHRETLEGNLSNLEAQVEALREALEEIAQADGTPDNKIHVPRSALISIAKKSLANLPARAEQVRKVLEAADKWYDEWKDYGAMSLSYIELRDAIRKRRRNDGV